MDATLIFSIVTPCLLIGGSIIAGFAKVWTKIADQNKAIGDFKAAVLNHIGEQNTAIGALKGAIGELTLRFGSYEKQMEGMDKRINELDKRMDSFINRKGV